MSETCRLRQGEGYAACSNEAYKCALVITRAFRSVRPVLVISQLLTLQIRLQQSQSIILCSFEKSIPLAITLFKIAPCSINRLVRFFCSSIFSFETRRSYRWGSCSRRNFFLSYQF